jgi:hypothetical protein
LSDGVDGSNQERFRITEAGNVGIGTTSPTRKLNVNGNVGINNQLLLDSANYGEHLSIRRGVYGYDTIVTGTRIDYSPTASTNTFKFLADLQTTGQLNVTGNAIVNGSVGIGTTSPSTKLHVVGSAGEFALSLQNSSNGDGIKITTENQTANNGFLWNQGSSNLVNMYSSSTTNASKMIMLAGGVDKIFFNTEGNSYFNGGNVGIGTTSPLYKLDVSGSIRAGGKLTYEKSAGSLSTTGYAVAGLLAGSNGNSCMFTFTAIGNTGHYQKVVYSCWNSNGTWNTSKVIDEGTNGLDIEASANASTITFTFKSRSGSLNYSPRVTIEASGHAINNTYA